MGSLQLYTGFIETSAAAAAAALLMMIHLAAALSIIVSVLRLSPQLTPSHTSSLLCSQLAIMEKNKLHILEEGVDDIIEPSTGNLYHMENLEVRSYTRKSISHLYDLGWFRSTAAAAAVVVDLVVSPRITAAAAAVVVAAMVETICSLLNVKCMK